MMEQLIPFKVKCIPIKANEIEDLNHNRDPLALSVNEIKYGAGYMMFTENSKYWNIVRDKEWMVVAIQGFHYLLARNGETTQFWPRDLCEVTEVPNG